MCSFFTQRVMGNDHGDLTDIVLGGGVSSSSGDQWRLASGSTNHQTTLNSFDDLLEGFGNPFTNTRDPLLHEMDAMVGGMAFNRPPNSGGEHSFLPHRVFGEDHCMNKRWPASNMFSRMLQISPNTSTSPMAATPPAAVAASPPAINTSQSDVIKAGNNSVGCTSMEDGAGVQIPTPRNPGIKRRKSQAKKVVCIPAPAAASSRSSGEVVPSDLWAWRKYGQKPIKGSPYPRGYYRCSSSKGCSARKQVERSRTDPNMLVITYTSEHNHPWPTQRNALAGSTRSQPLKGNSSLKNITPHANTSAKPSSTVDVKEEQKEMPNHEDNSKAVVPSDHHSKLSVKDEVVLAEDEIRPCLEMGDQDFDQVFHNSYMPLPLPDPGQPHDDFFADLDGLDPDPFSLMSSQGFPIREQTSHEKGQGKDSKASIDPFMDIYDWPSSGGS